MFGNKRKSGDLYRHVMANEADIQIWPLIKPKYMIPGDEERKKDYGYYYRVGLFGEDMMCINISEVIWYCNNNGSIWLEWFDHRNDWKLKSDESIPRFKMNEWQGRAINELTRELFLMHKLQQNLE